MLERSLHVARLALLSLCACGGEPPGFILLDAAASDARPALPDASSRRDAGPTLPSADRVVVLPYQGAPLVLDYEVTTTPSLFDLHVSVDTTASFADEIDALQATLIEEILPAVRQAIPDTSVGVSSFEDFPSAPFGGPDDRPFTLYTAVTSNVARVRAALLALDDPLGFGGDFPESGFEALYQIATGAGYRIAGTSLIPQASGSALEGGGTIGGVGFRPGSLRAVLHITDARSHVPSEYATAYPGTRGFTEATSALRAERIKVIGIASGAIARGDLELLALATDASMPPSGGACATGVGTTTHAPRQGRCPLVFDVLPDGTGLSGTITNALARLVESLIYESVYVELDDDRLGFVLEARAESATPPAGTAPPTLADLAPVDGVQDTFLEVRAGTSLRFTLTLANHAFPSLDHAQVFLLALRIVADGTLLIDETIRIVIPPRALPDASFPSDPDID